MISDVLWVILTAVGPVMAILVEVQFFLQSGLVPSTHKVSLHTPVFFGMTIVQCMVSILYWLPGPERFSCK